MGADQRRQKPLSNVDTAWLHMEEPTNPMVIAIVFQFDELIDFARLRSLIERRLLQFERFTQRVVAPKGKDGAVFWEPDPQFDLSLHLHRVGLPAPGDQAALRDFVSDQMSTRLDFGLSPWQMHLVEGFGKGCALLLRLHHCMADGMALRHILLSLMDGAGDEALAEVPKRNGLPGFLKPAARAFGAAASLTGALFHEGMETLTNPGHVLEIAGLGLSGAAAIGKLALIGPDPASVYKGPLGLRKRAAWSAPIPLTAIKAVGRATGATINDVLLASLSGALQRYACERGDPIPRSIRAVVPVNLRSPEAAPDGGNHFGLVFVDLPVAIDDPLARLQAVRRETDGIKHSAEAVVAFGLLGAMGSAPLGIERTVVDLFGAKATAVITNVPGPRELFAIAGQPLRHAMFWVPQSGHLGVGISILSYAGEVLLGIATDAGLVPDPERVVAAFHEEFECLAAAASVEAPALPE